MVGCDVFLCLSFLSHSVSSSWLSSSSPLLVSLCVFVLFGVSNMGMGVCRMASAAVVRLSVGMGCGGNLA